MKKWKQIAAVALSISLTSAWGYATQSIDDERDDEKEKVSTSLEVTLEKEVVSALPKIEHAKGKDLVLIFGVTGAGKSTLTNVLLGHKALWREIETKKDNKNTTNNKRKRRRGGSKKLKKVVDIQKNPSISAYAHVGHSMVSETYYPTCYVDKKQGLTYCDCPGLMDNRGPAQEYCVALTTRAIIEEANSIKAIMCLVPYASIQERSTLVVFKELLQTLDSLLSKGKNENTKANLPKYLKTSIFFIFTKAPKDTNLDDCFDKLEEHEEALQKTSETNHEDKALAEIITMILNLDEEQDDNDKDEDQDDDDEKEDDNQNVRSLHLFDPFSPQSKQELLNALKHSEPMPSKDFGFPAGDRVKEALRTLFDKKALQAVIWLRRDDKNNDDSCHRRIDKLSKEYKKTLQQISDEEKSIKDSTSEGDIIEKSKKEADRRKRELDSIRSQLKSARSELSYKLRKKYGLINEINDCKRGEEEYTSKDWYMFLCEIGGKYIIRCTPWNCSETLSIPYCKVELSNTCRGSWDIKNYNPGSCYYNALFTSTNDVEWTGYKYYDSSRDNWFGGKVTATFYVKKEDYYKSKIRSLEGELKEAEKDYSRYCDKVRNLETKADETIEIINQLLSGLSKEEVLKTMIEHAKKSLVQFKKEGDRLKKELDEQNNLLEEARQGLEKQKSFLNFMVLVKSFAPIDGIDGTMLPKFYKLYPAHQRRNVVKLQRLNDKKITKTPPEGDEDDDDEEKDDDDDDEEDFELIE